MFCMLIDLGTDPQLGCNEVHALGRKNTSVELTAEAKRSIKRSYEQVGDWLNRGT